MPEATFVRDFDKTNVTLAASAGIGEVRQLADGRAGWLDYATAKSSGDKVDFKTAGCVAIPKASGVVILDGGRVYWDHSANQATYTTANDRDFYVGTAQGDFGSGDVIVYVNLNVQQRNILDIANDPFVTAIVGTQALGGLGLLRRGGAHNIILSSTSEAQKVDILTRAGFATGANAIIEAIVNVISDGAGTVVDVSVGAANGTNATDADSITESLFLHLDANNVNINFESDDGSTEVAATDSTIDYTEGTPFEVWFDMRDPADVQVYVNGSLVLGSTTFNVSAATGPWKLLVHVEKSSSSDTYEIDINRLTARIAEQ